MTPRARRDSGDAARAGRVPFTAMQPNERHEIGRAG